MLKGVNTPWTEDFELDERLSTADTAISTCWGRQARGMRSVTRCSVGSSTHLGSRSQFRASVDRVIETVKNSALAVGFDEVLVPGEPEQRNLARSDQHGLVVPSRLRADLSSLAVELGIVIEW